MKKVLFWLFSPIWLPLGIILAVIALAIGLFSVCLLLALPIFSVYFIYLGILSIFSGLIFTFAHFFSMLFLVSQGIFFICVATIFWRILRLVVQKIYRPKKLKKEPKKIVFKKPIIKVIVCILLMSISIFLGGKNSFYWTASGPTLPGKLSIISTYHPKVQPNINISLDNVNLEINNGDVFTIRYYGDDIPILNEDIENTLEISAINSHPNPKYSINPFGAKNASLIITIPRAINLNAINISGTCKKASIVALNSSKTNIETSNCQINISSVFATILEINNPGGNINLKYGYLRGDSNLTAQNIYANLFHNPRYAYNAQGNSIKFNGEYAASPFSYVYNNAQAQNSVNITGNDITIDLTGTLAPDFDKYIYDYLKDFEEQLKNQEETE